MGLSLGYSNLSLSPTQIKFRLQKPNPSPTWILKIIAQTCPNFGLGSGWIEPIHRSCNPSIILEGCKYKFREKISWCSSMSNYTITPIVINYHFHEIMSYYKNTLKIMNDGKNNFKILINWTKKIYKLYTFIEPSSINGTY